MTKVRESSLIKELKRRTQTQSKKFELAQFCFDKQLAFIQDPARFKDAVCSRRSGKTIACAADLIHTALTNPGDVAYITLSRRSAKKIIWRELLKLNKDYNLNFKVDAAELTLTSPAGHMIHVSGAKDESEIEKFRGMSLRKVYIDEAQSFRPYIKELIEDIIEPALTDYYGSLILIGTPGPVPAGYFYDATHGTGSSHHHWTMQDNPHIKLKSGKDPLEIIKETADRRGLTINSPSIQREFFGLWVPSTDDLVYQFNPAINVAKVVPDGLRYVFGIDIGFNDADAIAVLGYSETEQKVYLVEEYLKRGDDITGFTEKIHELRAKYDPVKMVIDAGGLGKKINEELLVRKQLPIAPAEKARKNEFIALLNDDLRRGRFQAFANSQFEADCGLLEWDYSVPDRPKVSTSFHTDIGDAVLYAWRECRHFYPKEAPAPKLTVDQYMAELEAKEAEAMERSLQATDNQFTDVQDWTDLGIGDDYSDDF